MKIGVIGGNGVAATNRLCEMVERKVTAAGAFRDAHHPEMVVMYATQAPSRSMFLEGRGSDWRPDYIAAAKTLKALGCDYGCMCCNTAHYAINEVAGESGLEFISLVDEVASKAKALGYGRYELFCTDGARKFDIYGKVFKRVCPNVEVVYPSAERQAKVTEVICAVKTAKRFDGDGVPQIMLDRIVAESANPVILGCTDLRVAYKVNDDLPSGVAIDSLECLADAIAEKWLRHKNW